MGPAIDEPGSAGKGSEAHRGLGGWLGIYMRGLAMGVAELIPGVSGGTIAFITGIYLELVATIRGLGPRLLQRVGQGRFAEAWREGNLGFLAVLGAGMGTAILALARIVQFLLEHRELQVWGFFFGLILASAVFVGRHVHPWTPVRWSVAVLGVVVGAGAAFLTALSLPVTTVTVFLGGAVAICAWILPGVSGSFVMLLLGLYPAVVAAIAELDLTFLAILAAGCTTGILLFSRFLTWILRRRYEATLAVLSGFMAGSLLKLWPWHLPAAVVEGKPMGVRLHLPAGFEAASGESAALGGVVAAMILGVAVVGGLELFARTGRSGAPVADAVSRVKNEG
jgi:putative membrane protein